MPTWFPIIASTALAAFPVVIWLKIIHQEGEQRSLYTKTFLMGTLAVIPPFLLILLFQRFPELDIYSRIGKELGKAASAALLTNVIVGIIEEIAKNIIVRVIDRRHPEYIQTIGSALKLSICAGLGFSFAENIFYFSSIWMNNQYGFSDLFSSFVFRSLFTMCMHMLVSGIFGYYFGLGKFSADITEAQRWEGQSFWFARMLCRLTGRATFEVVRELKNLEGLLLAMGIHASFNALLDLDHKLIPIGIVAVSATYVWYLMKTRSGHLMFSTGRRRASTMASNDEDVVVELLGLWLAEGKLKEVIETCDRLLKRDPDNNVVKLFRAKALDNEKIRQVYEALKMYFKKVSEREASQRETDGGTDQALVVKALAPQEEKVVLEVMDAWYKEGKYKEVLDVANRLLDKNPKSEGAALLMAKALDHKKLQGIFDSLSRLFQEE